MSWQIVPHGDVVVVTVNSNKVNAQNEGFYRDLHETFDRLEQEFPQQAVVLTAEDGIFSAGLDLRYVFSLFKRGDDQLVREWFERYRATNMRLFTYPYPTVAAVNGHAFAGGLITALACDFRVAARSDSYFSLNEVPVGIPMPSTYTEIIRYATGDYSARHSILSGQSYTCEQALELKLVDELVEPDQLLERAVEVASRIAPASLGAYAASKRALQAHTLELIERLSPAYDERCAAILTTADSLEQQAKAYRMLTGEEVPEYRQPSQL